jgi:membrane fusion protein, heavy metal efflux system
MIRLSDCSHRPVVLRLSAGILLTLNLLTSPAAVFAHAGHGDEFKGAHEDTQGSTSISVDAKTATRLGIKVEPATRQLLAIGIKTTGQIETLPNQKVEVRPPVSGTVVELLVKPGDQVSKGEPLAVLSSSELAQLRVESLSKQAEAEADLQQAQGDLKLAQGNYDRVLKIAEAEILQAKTQLAAATKQYEGEQELVNTPSVVGTTKQNYQRQIEIASAEIAQAETEVAVAQETYDRDRELVEEGAIPRRTMLESQAKLAAAKTALTKASQRANVIQAETEIKQAEINLPMRELRDAQGKVAEAQTQLTKALSPVAILEAENQLKRAQNATEIAQSRIRLSNAAYQARLQQLGTIANDKGLVTVLAPITGTVSDREITPGESVNAAEKPLMTLLNNSGVFATANIYEKDLNQVKEGQEVRVKVASLPNRIFRGTISRIGSSVQGETRVVPVQAELNNPDGKLKPGLFAEVEILTEQTASNVLAISSSAIVDVNGKKTVYVQNGNAYQSVEVQLGETSGDMVEIKSGLFDGDLIVTQRAPQLYAQSLRGGNKHSEAEEKKVANTQKLEANLNSFPLPLWLVGAVGGTILGVGAFSVGVLAGRRKRDRSFVLGNSEYSTIAYETEAYLENHNPPTLPISVSVGNYEENHPPNPEFFGN